jgi:amidase
MESALELAARIRRGEVTSEALVAERLARIDALNPLLQAFTDVTARRALRAARRKDRAPSDAPFHGVPIGVKDLNLVRGTFTRFGSDAYRWLVAPFDDPLTQAIRRAGFVILGKLATSEFGTVPVTEPSVHAPTRNPWSPDRTSGGSSGGSASAVAAGLLPIAHASDGGGSIRIPAAFCHLFGYKSSRGLNQFLDKRIDRVSLTVEGCVSHTVDDAVAFTRALGSALPDLPPVPSRLRIGLAVEGGVGPTGAPHADAARRVASALAALGHEVVEQPPLAGAVEEFLPMWARMAADIPLLRESAVQPVTRWLREQGRATTHDDASRAHASLSARIDAWCGDLDLWVTPTVGGPPPRVGTMDGLAPRDAFAAIAPIGQYTAPFNVSGQPAATLPAGLDDDGLPIGVQLVARRGQDALLLAVCRHLEAELPWRGRAPVLARR